MGNLTQEEKNMVEEYVTAFSKMVDSGRDALPESLFEYLGWEAEEVSKFKVASETHWEETVKSIEKKYDSRPVTTPEDLHRIHKIFTPTPSNTIS